MKKLEELGISPAPWEVKHHPEESSDEFEILSADGKFVGPIAIGYGIPKSMANFLAAAPDIYDALQQIMQCWGASVFDEGGMGCDTPLYCKHAGCRPETCPVFLRAKSALAKAAGEETK